MKSSSTPAKEVRRRFTRRTVLQAAGAATLVGSAGCGGLRRREPHDTLVLVFLRGGMDSLSLLVPHGDDAYYRARPKTGVPSSQVHDLDGYFGLSQVGEPLIPLYESGRLALAPAVGHAVDTRSHFQSMRHVEEAYKGAGSVGSGWVARHLNVTPQSGAGPGRAIALDSTLPFSLQGGPATIPVPSLADFGFGGLEASRARRMACLQRMYGAAPEPDRSSGRAALGLVHELAAIDFVHRTPNGGAQYPEGKLGRGLFEAASLIKNHSGVEVIEVDSGDWDDHRATGPLDGAFAARMNGVAKALSAFSTDLGEDADRVTTLVISEFGRTLLENGSGGTAHGRGGVAMILGGAHVMGGQLHGDWPGLTDEQLDDGAIRVTVDVRDVMAEILKKRLHTADLDSVLLGHTPSMPGLLRA